MTELLTIFVLAMIVDAGVAYLGLGIAMAEFKGIYLPFIKYVYKNGERRKWMI